MNNEEIDQLALGDIPDYAWRLLEDASKQRSNAFHTPVLSTFGEQYPQSRIVVLRKVDRDQATIDCHTDLRSGKIAELESQPAMSWVFYDAARKLQLRVRGQGRVFHQDDQAKARWQGMAEHSKRCYAQEIPAGQVVDEIVGAAPCPDVTDTQLGWPNFAIVSCAVTEIEWLYLSSQGHLRALCNYSNQGWSAQWIMP